MLHEGSVDLFESNVSQERLDGILAEQEVGLAVLGCPKVNPAA
jgi:hypothetical protein